MTRLGELIANEQKKRKQPPLNFQLANEEKPHQQCEYKSVKTQEMDLS